MATPTPTAVKTAVIVEPDAALSDALSTVLTMSGYRVIAVPSPGRALACCRTMHPDVLIARVILPVLDVMKLARIVRSHPSSRAMTIVLLGDVGTLTPRSFFYDAILPHPISVIQVLGTVERLIWSGSRGR